MLTKHRFSIVSCQKKKKLNLTLALLILINTNLPLQYFVVVKKASLQEFDFTLNYGCIWVKIDSVYIFEITALIILLHPPMS